MIPSTRRDQQAAATKALVAATARKVFADRGYSDVTIRDIAKACGMSTGAIFAHYSGKDELWHVTMQTFTPDEAALAFPVVWSALRDAIKGLETARANIEPQTIGWHRATDALIQARRSLALATYAEPKEIADAG